MQYLSNIATPFNKYSIPNWLKGCTATLVDARYFQIVFLVSLLLFGALARDFSLTNMQVMLTFISAIGTQAFWQFYLAAVVYRGQNTT